MHKAQKCSSLNIIIAPCCPHCGSRLKNKAKSNRAYPDIIFDECGDFFCLAFAQFCSSSCSFCSMLLFHVFLQIQQTRKTTINHHFCGHFRLPINTLRWKQIALKKHAVYDLCVNIHFSSGTVSACQLSQAPMLSGYRQRPTLDEMN
jgi:hypothetical protein